MNNGGDAAEQVVRLSLEGFEVAAKLTGAAAKNIGVLLVAALKQEQKTKGKARLTNMIRSGKELKVFSVQNKDLKKFTQEAKRYGVLYCVLRDKSAKSDNSPIDIIARAEDASKIARIIEKFEFGTVDKASIVTEVERSKSEKEAKEKTRPEKLKSEMIMEEAVAPPNSKEENSMGNPSLAKTREDLPSGQNLKRDQDTATKEGSVRSIKEKPSVKEKLDYYKAEKEKAKVKDSPSKEKSYNKSYKNKKKTKNKTTHKKQKAKER